MARDLLFRRPMRRFAVLVLLVACADQLPSGDPPHDLSELARLATIEFSSDLMCGSTARPTCMTDALRDGHVAKLSESLVPQDDPDYETKILFTYQGSVYDFYDAFDRTTGGEDISEQH